LRPALIGPEFSGRADLGAPVATGFRWGGQSGWPSALTPSWSLRPRPSANSYSQAAKLPLRSVKRRPAWVSVTG